MTEVIRDQVYAVRPQRVLQADLYLPDAAVAVPAGAGTSPGSVQAADANRASGARRPAILWLHGGGWRFGDRRQCPSLERYYAQRGYVMVSIDYRRSQEALFPAAVEDVKTAARWLKSQAGRYGIDPDRIGLWGSSAGGHLAALAAISAEDRFRDTEYSPYSSSVAAVVDAYGPSDFLRMDAHRDPDGKPSDDLESIQLPPGKQSADADSLESLFLGAPIQTCPERVRAANPVTYVHGHVPPFLLLHGASDTAIPAHQSQLLYAALAAGGNDVTLGLVRGLGHGFLNRANLDEQEREIELTTAAGSPPGVKRTRVFEMIGEWFDHHL